MSASLAERLEEDIRRRGSIGLDCYMRAALLDAREGYYATGNPLGRDFTTAPEVSQMFGELLGLWCADVWQCLGKPERMHLLEPGAGRGTLMRDALRALRQACPDFLANAELHLIEASAVLREAQADALADTDTPVFWHETLEEFPPGVMLLLANEFFDALPVRQFQYTREGWRERRVGLGEETRFAICLGEACEIRDASSAPAIGEILETCPEGEAIARQIGARLARDGGAALIVDYGSAMRPSGETFSGLQRSGFVDPLAALPGSADLSAWVDFRALARAAQAGGGVKVFGPVPQGSFLRRLGIAERAAQLCEQADDTQKQQIETDLARLVDPQGMGAVFKAMALVSATMPDAPAGFLAEEIFNE